MLPKVFTSHSLPNGFYDVHMMFSFISQWVPKVLKVFPQHVLNSNTALTSSAPNSGCR